MKKKHVILPFIVFILSLFSYISAGAPDTLWTRTYGGDSTDIGRSVQQTSDGGFIIAGYTYSFGAGESDVYLIRTDSKGDTLWTRTYGDSLDDVGLSVQQTSDGGFVIAGSKEVIDVLYFYHLYLIRTDSNGDTLWTKLYESGQHTPGNSVQQVNDDGFIIAGSNAFPDLEPDVYIVRTDTIGDILWTKIYGNGNYVPDVGYSCQQTTDGGFIITGIFANTDVYLLRTDSNGDTLWTRTYGNGYGYSVQQTSDGGFVIAGSLLIKTDSIGDTLWTKTYGGNSVQQTSDGGYIVLGNILIKTDSIGDTLWTKAYGGNEVQQTSDGGFIVVGVISSSGAGGEDVYLVRLDKDSTAIQQEIPFNFFNPNNFIVSYNNGNISIHYTIPYSTSVNLEAFDIKGKLVKVITDKFMQKGSYSVNWDSKRFGAGVYYIKLSAANNSLIQKVIILK